LAQIEFALAQTHRLSSRILSLLYEAYIPAEHCQFEKTSKSSNRSLPTGLSRENNVARKTLGKIDGVMPIVAGLAALGGFTGDLAQNSISPLLPRNGYMKQRKLLQFHLAPAPLVRVENPLFNDCDSFPSPNTQGSSTSGTL